MPSLGVEARGSSETPTFARVPSCREALLAPPQASTPGTGGRLGLNLVRVNEGIKLVPGRHVGPCSRDFDGVALIARETDRAGHAPLFPEANSNRFEQWPPSMLDNAAGA